MIRTAVSFVDADVFMLLISLNHVSRHAKAKGLGGCLLLKNFSIKYLYKVAKIKVLFLEVHCLEVVCLF